MEGLVEYAEDQLAQGLDHRYAITDVAIDLARRLLARKESLEKLAAMSLVLAKQWDPDRIFYPGHPDDIETMERWINFFFGRLEEGYADRKVRYSSSQAAAASFQPTQPQPARSYPDRATEMGSWCSSDATLVLSSSVSLPP
jgi:hypothetical protein